MMKLPFESAAWLVFESPKRLLQGPGFRVSGRVLKVGGNPCIVFKRNVGT